MQNKLSDIILKDDNLLGYAKKLCGQYYMDYFNSAWLSFREKELKDQEFNTTMAKSYKAYFAVMIRNEFLDDVRRNKVFYCDELPEVSSNDVDFSKIDAFFRKEDNNRVYRNIIEITSKVKNKQEAVRLTGLNRRTFYRIFKDAEELLKQEL